MLGALLIWSFYGDGSLENSHRKRYRVLWNGLAAPGERNPSACPAPVKKGNRNETQVAYSLLVVALVSWRLPAIHAGWFHHDTALQSSGTVEARNIRVGSKIGGRIDKVLVREGDSVEPGQILITFDDKELQAAAFADRAPPRKNPARIPAEEIAEARAAAAQAKAEYDQRKNGYRQEDIDAAKADLDRATADEVRARI